MPNNPYSPEAIKRRLSAKSTSSLFDIITTKGKEIGDEEIKPSIDVVDNNVKIIQEEEMPVKDESHTAPNLTVNGDHMNYHNGIRSDSPSVKILKDVLAEEVPQYKRYVA